MPPHKRKQTSKATPAAIARAATALPSVEVNAVALSTPIAAVVAPPAQVAVTAAAEAPEARVTGYTWYDGNNRDLLEGLLPLKVVEWPPAGYLLTPPRAGAGRQRVFLPRIAVLSIDLLGLIGAAKSGLPAKKTVPPDLDQLKMFDQ